MLRRFIALSLFVAMVFFSAVALAHPGKTDSKGGHYNRSTGEYHYHHGYPEHQHVNGVCPYDFKDNTNANAASPTRTPNKTKKKNDDSAELKAILLTGATYLGIPAVFVTGAIIKGEIKRRRR